MTIVEQFVPDPASDTGPESESEAHPPDLALAQEQIGRAILEAALRDPVPSPVPGKFAGDIA